MSIEATMLIVIGLTALGFVVYYIIDQKKKPVKAEAPKENPVQK